MLFIVVRSKLEIKKKGIILLIFKSLWYNKKKEKKDKTTVL